LTVHITSDMHFSLRTSDCQCEETKYTKPPQEYRNRPKCKNVFQTHLRQLTILNTILL